VSRRRCIALDGNGKKKAIVDNGRSWSEIVYPAVRA
jgi:hypothetical protein